MSCWGGTVEAERTDVTAVDGGGVEPCHTGKRESESEGKAASERRGKSGWLLCCRGKENETGHDGGHDGGTNSEGKDRRGVYRCSTLYDCDVYLAVDVTMNG